MNLRLISGRMVAIVWAQAEQIVSTMTDVIRDISLSSDSAVFSAYSAVFSLFGRADFLPPLEILGAATPQPILITTIWVLIIRGTRGAAGWSGDRWGGRASTG
jgi:hypothetical protein